MGEVAGVLGRADVGDAVGVEARAADEPIEAAAEAAADAAAEGVDDPLAPHAVRAAPPMTAAIITTGTRHILMLLPSAE